MSEIRKFPASGLTPTKCVICNYVSHGYHFGVLSCRACAAFFRRSITENKVYKCFDGLNCVISRERKNMCRGCRYQKCEQSGMNKNDIQFNRDPIGHKKISNSEKSTAPTFSHDSFYIPTSSTNLIAPSNPINVPQDYNPPSLTTLERIDFGCKEYFFGQPTPGENDHYNRPSFAYITHAAICQLDKDHSSAKWRTNISSHLANLTNRQRSSFYTNSSLNITCWKVFIKHIGWPPSYQRMHGLSLMVTFLMKTTKVRLLVKRRSGMKCYRIWRRC